MVVGGVFLGAVHDYMALFVSIREGGKSMAEVARKSLGTMGFNLFIFFTILMLIVYTAVLLSATSISLTSLWPLSKIGAIEGKTILKSVVQNGVAMGRIGGIASMSVIVITLFAPILGWLIYRRGLKQFPAYVLAITVCVLSVLLGIQYPISLSPNIWMIILSVYVLIAAGVPVWVILQPRDFINSQILYAGIGLMIVSLISNGLQGGNVSMPLLNIADGAKNLGMIWPMMFITIACGAISGFHALVAGGTTGKQLSNETDTRKIGYNAMLLESMLAVCVLLALGTGLNFEDYKALVWPIDPAVKSNPILGFSLAAGSLFYKGLGIPMELGTVFGILMVEGFVVTSLDAAVRLNRYLFEELWAILFNNPPKFLKHYWFNSFLAVLFMWSLAYSNAFKALWPIFGAANQLMAALALIAISAWLLMKGRRYFFALFPAAFMVVTTLAALIVLFFSYIKQSNYTLMSAAVVLFVLALGVVILAFKTFTRRSVRS